MQSHGGGPRRGSAPPFVAYLTLLILVVCGKTVKADPERLDARVGGVLVPFVANRGQVDRAVAFYAPTFAGTAYVTHKGEIVYSLSAADTRIRASGLVRGITRKAGWTLTETPIGGKGRPHVGQASEAHASYFIGNDPARWRSGIPTYESVDLGEVWPGVSLSLRAHGKNVEKLFTVEPGADPSRISMRVAGGRSLEVNESGALVITTGLGGVTFSPPLAYQVHGGVRRAVGVRYRTRGQGYGFSLGGYDPALTLTIDPILQTTYLGGSDGELGFALAIHPATGEVFVTGSTISDDFPGTAGGAQPSTGRGEDVFVARLDRTLTTLNQGTYLGGSDDDEGGEALAIDPTTGDVLVVGMTASADFPGTVGGAQASMMGGYDAFLARLNSTLMRLNQATYLGGGGEDVGLAVAIHPTTGEVFVAGYTASGNLSGTAGGAQARSGGNGDGFVARWSASLTTLNQVTYLGGSAYDFAAALMIDAPTGQVFVSGATSSIDFPGTVGGAQSASGGSHDAFVARLNATLTTLPQATYLGGGSGDFGYALALDPTVGEVFVAGYTRSPDFPGTAGGAQASARGVNGDAFVARLNAFLTRLNQATYLGGSDEQLARALALHPTTGEVFVAGATSSIDFPGTAGGAQALYAGPTSFQSGTPPNGDAFVARLNRALTTLNQATYLGGSLDERAIGLAIHPATGEVFITGWTGSIDFPGTAGGVQAVKGGYYAAFVARLTADLRAEGQGCAVDSSTLCLNDNRFRVQVSWRAANLGTSGQGQAVLLTSDTGHFWFFSANNIELVVKVVDGRAFNGFFWVFYGALSDVEYTITVTDMETGAVKSYFNPQGRLASVADTAAFAATGSGAPPITAGHVSFATVGEAAACSGDPTTLCLNGSRFRVQVAWRAVHLGTSGQGQAMSLTTDTGYFWFFSANNVELVLKVVDGRAFNGKYWVFYGALSDVEYTITVTDTETGAVQTYFNPQGRLASVADTAAF